MRGFDYTTKNALSSKSDWFSRVIKLLVPQYAYGNSQIICDYMCREILLELSAIFFECGGKEMT